MKSEDINLVKFTVYIFAVIFTTWLIEINTDLERLHVVPFVCVAYAFMFFVFSREKKG